MPPAIRVTSRANPLVERARRLLQRKHRRREDAFFIEGPRAFLSAVEAGAPIETVFYSPDLLTSPFVRHVLAGDGGEPGGVEGGAVNRRGLATGAPDRPDLATGAFGPADLAVGAVDRPVLALDPVVRVVSVPAEVFATLSDRDHPTGIGAIVRPVEVELAELRVRPADVFVALAGVSDPGNLGAILRTMDALGAAGLVLVGPETTDPYHPTAVKASMGALFTVPLARAAWAELWEWAARARARTVATSARAELASWSAAALVDRPLVLLLGGERQGLPAEALERADRRVAIPMGGHATSLNLAVAAGILLYEARRPRDVE